MFKKSSKKRPANIRSSESSSSASSQADDAESTALLQAARLSRDGNTNGNTKRHKSGAGTVVDAVSTSGGNLVHQFASDITAGRSTKTFATLETETEAGSDTRAALEATLAATQGGVTNDDTGLYAGSANYKAIIPKSLDSIRSNKATGFSGPLRANTTIRMTSRFDYQPDVCKDYKETGFCGFGDTCIFMHDRGGDPKASQLEDEWAIKKKEREDEQERAMNKLLCQVAGEEEATEEAKQAADDMPFACFVCRGAFTDPQESVCGHYFCSGCITAHYKKQPSCPVCKKDLGGVFKRPDKLIKKKKRMGKDTWEEFKAECEKKKEAREKEKEKAGREEA
jgi:RING finger protein 113A